MNKTYEFNDLTTSGKTIITIDNNTLKISRPGVISKFSHGFSGEKTYLINQISSVQIKKAGIGRGFIQFILAGTKEAKSGMIFGDHKDENIIYFASTFHNKKTNADAEEIQKYITDFNSNQNDNIIKQDDKYDQLAKLKKLLDDGTLTQQEYDLEKEKLLNQIL